jgi:hypothetical protein
MKITPLENEKPLLVNEVLPDNSPEGAHEKKLARYASAKVRQELVSDFILQRKEAPGKKSLQKEAIALQECGSFLVFRHYYTLGMYKLVAGSTCKKHLLCALCAIRRAAKCIALYSEKISQVKGDKDFDEVMITFTIRNGEDLQERFDHLLGSMKKLLQKRNDSQKINATTHTEMMHVSGAVYSYEVTFSKEKGFHPHCHMIALVPPGRFKYSTQKIKGKSVEVPQVLKDGIVEDWKKITGDSFIVDVRKIENSEMPEQGQDIQGTRLEALVEVFKYALKMNRIDKDSPAESQENIRIQVEAYEILRGRRMIGSFGSLWGVKIPSNNNDEPLQDSEIPYIDLVYQYSGANFGYQLTSHGVVDTSHVSTKKLQDDRIFKQLLRKAKIEA